MAGRKYQAPQGNPYGGIIQSTAPADQAPKEPKQEYYRLNLKIPVEYKEYLQEIAWQNRTTITGYLCDMIQADMEAHPHWRDGLDALNK